MRNCRPPSGTNRVLAAICALAVALTSCEQVDREPAATARIEEWMSWLSEKHWFNGALIVSEGDQLIYSRGFGYADFSKKIPFTPETTADTGSYTKSVVATAILFLEEEGKLDTADPVDRYLPEFPYEDVRIVDLLTHSSGLRDHDFFEAMTDLEVEWTNEFFLAALRTHKPELLFPTGTRFQYNNLGYDLLALVIERVGGAPFEAYLRKQFFDPLEMKDVFQRPRYFKDWKTERTVGYEYVDGVLSPNDSANNEGIYGSANLFFSAEDLQKWNLSFLDRPVLSKATLQRALPRYRLDNGTRSDLNLLCLYVSEDESQFWFTGHWAGFYTMVYRDVAKRRSIVYVTNASMPMWLRAGLTVGVREILDGDTTTLEVPEFVTLDEAQLGSVTGAYAMPTLGDCRVSRSNRSLFLEFADGARFRMFRVDPAVLYLPEKDAWIGFGTDAATGLPKMFWTTPARRESGLRVGA